MAHCIRPPQALFHPAHPVPLKPALYREDAAVPVRGRSEPKRRAYSTVYVEPLRDAKTKPGKGRVSARLRRGLCSKTFFTILP